MPKTHPYVPLADPDLEALRKAAHKHWLEVMEHFGPKTPEHAQWLKTKRAYYGIEEANKQKG